MQESQAQQLIEEEADDEAAHELLERELAFQSLPLLNHGDFVFEVVKLHSEKCTLVHNVDHLVILFD